MDFIDQKLSDYIEQHTSPENEVLQNLNRETHLKVLQARMLSGHLQGRVLAMISQMIRPQNILEIGTYTGYSALCLAEGLADNGKLTTLEVNEEMEGIILKYIEQAGLKDKINLIIGNALEIIPNLASEFDLVFIDADKVNYYNYYNLAFDKTKTGGFILVDNVLWDGKVIQAKANPDKKTKAILAFNQQIQADNRVENVLLPIRDGLMLIRKKVKF